MTRAENKCTTSAELCWKKKFKKKNREYCSNDAGIAALKKNNKRKTQKKKMNIVPNGRVLSLWSATANCERKKTLRLIYTRTIYTYAHTARFIQINVCSQLWKSKIRCHTHVRAPILNTHTTTYARLHSRIGSPNAILISLFLTHSGLILCSHWMNATETE